VPRFNPGVLFQKVTIAGVGLLGGSLGLALKQRGLATKVDGLVRRSASIAECARYGVVDHATCDPERAAEGADLIVLCTPLSRMKEVLEAMAPALKAGVVVTDVGSAKTAAVQELEPLATAAGGLFVGSHPLAGAERTGPAAARADLFAGAVCVVTPTPRSSAIAVRQIEELWQALGSHVLRMKPETHDDLVSRSSHLPHVVAAELANYVLSPAHPREQHLLCASGFRDTTRVAASSPAMWRDIVLANRENLIRVLGVFIEGLEEFRHALQAGDVRAVTEFLEQARTRRENWAHTETSMRSME
jgi:prephenate dehydrogenase